VTISNVNKEKLIKLCGTVLVGIALFFVFHRLWANREWILKWQPTPQIFLILSFCTVAYAVASYALPIAWFRLLIWYGQPDADLRNCLSLYARTQIAKYIPGNVFHFAGRHVMGRQLGWDHAPLAAASLFEILGMLVASSAIALLGLTFLGVREKHISSLGIAAIFTLTLLFPVLLNKLASRFKLIEKLYLPGKKSADIFIGLLPVYLLYLAFFLALGGLFLVVVHGIAGLSDFGQAGPIITVFAVAWITGFITPGAPAGFGIREMVIVGSLSTFIGEPESIFIAFLFRIVTVCGDFLFFLSSFLFGRHLHIEERK